MKDQNRIFVRKNIDLDTICAIWAIRKFVAEKKPVQVLFRSENWKGTGMTDNDLAIGLHAGGKGIVTEGSVFSEVVRRFASEKDWAILKPLIRFVGKTRHIVLEDSAEPEIVASLAFIVFSMKEVGYDDAEILAGISSILDDLYKALCKRYEREMDFTELTIIKGPRATVALNDRGGVHRDALLFRSGVEFIVIADERGNLAVLRNKDSSKPILTVYVERILEEVDEPWSYEPEEGKWFYHPEGFILSWSTRKHTAQYKSKVDPLRLAKAVAGIYE
ncbi:MAG: hypothetical protein DRG31_07460 [Deltaproteobacteria bacterium]|nr:MAG: hypothetical protein DRG31_07460 [Deltaproteobacteria bacterium]